MTTVILVVLCLVVGALELYAGKQSKDQATAFARRIDELREEVGKQNGVLVTVGEQLTAELARVKRDVLPGLESRLRRNSGQIEELAQLVHRADEFLRTQAGRLGDLEQQRVTLAALRRKLADLEGSMAALPETLAKVPAPEAAAANGRVDAALTRLSDLERNNTEILELQRDLTRTLEDVEDIVADLMAYTEGELDEEAAVVLYGRTAPAVTIVGRLWSRDPQLRDVLAEVYERCVATVRLRVRFRSADPASGRRRYFLAGQNIEDLAGGFTAVLISTGTDATPSGGRRAPGDELALKALLRALHETGGGTAQIGPLVAVRTREELLCAVLTPAQAVELENDQLFNDPAAAAVRLRRMPAHQVWDLTPWASRPPAR